MTGIDPRSHAARRPCPAPLDREPLENWADVPVLRGDRDDVLSRRAGGADPVTASRRSLPCSDCNLAFGRHLHLHVYPVPVEVGRVREAVRTALCAWGCPSPVIDDSVLLASELLGNAVMHGPDALITVNLVHVGDRLLLEVTDASPVRPTVRQSGLEEEQGRGMFLVQAIASAWGSRQESLRGKTTWCTLALDGAVQPPRPPLHP
ncbi:ATP-binding protein [Streptomyces hirsutus]|uniref:ATP-binding protein n=1 Tax=Streptomyces hirsutus TaxID=35620 RepID=UPI0033255B09